MGEGAERPRSWLGAAPDSKTAKRENPYPTKRAAFADAEEFKMTVGVPIMVLTAGLAFCLFCIKDPHAGVPPFNQKYAEQQIEVARVAGVWGFTFTVPRPDIVVGTTAIVAPVAAEIVRGDPQPDAVDGLKQLNTLLDKKLRAVHRGERS